jgi:hypothetical protein
MRAMVALVGLVVVVAASPRATALSAPRSARKLHERHLGYSRCPRQPSTTINSRTVGEYVGRIIRNRPSGATS